MALSIMTCSPDCILRTSLPSTIVNEDCKRGSGVALLERPRKTRPVMGSACVGAEKEISNLVFPVGGRVTSWAAAVEDAAQTIDVTIAKLKIMLNERWRLFIDRKYSAPLSDGS